MTLDHERLDVYRLALDFLVFAHQVLETLPRGRAHLSDQLTRASTSIVLNIAEGAALRGRPPFSTRGVLVRSVYRAVEAMPLVVAVGLKCQEQAFPLAGFRPAVEAVEHGLPRTEVRWKIPPRNACAAPPQYRFDESTIIVCRPASSAFRLQKQVEL